MSLQRKERCPGRGGSGSREAPGKHHPAAQWVRGGGRGGGPGPWGSLSGIPGRAVSGRGSAAADGGRGRGCRRGAAAAAAAGARGRGAPATSAAAGRLFGRVGAAAAGCGSRCGRPSRARRLANPRVPGVRRVLETRPCRRFSGRPKPVLVLLRLRDRDVRSREAEARRLLRSARASWLGRSEREPAR